MSHRTRITHGMTHTKFYTIWTNMRQRCGNPKSHAYGYYGGRGIECRWDKFQPFFDEMYPSYLQHAKEHGEDNTTLDRIDTNDSYYKENCRWATWYVQSMNRRPKEHPKRHFTNKVELIPQICSSPSEIGGITHEQIVEQLFHLTRAVNTLIVHFNP